MLAVTANWGLTDGTLGGWGPADAGRWLERIQAAVVRAGWGPTGRYRPVERLTLVLAGDTFDLLLSDRWGGRIKPWHGGRLGREARRDAAAAAVQAARLPIGRLCRWVHQGLAVPAADARGRPVETIRSRVAVEVIVLGGDRDRDLAAFAGGSRWRGLQLGSLWSDDRHTIQHGEELDPARFSDHDRAQGFNGRREPRPTLADSVAVDLLVPFALAVRSMPGAWRQVRPRVAALAAADLGSLVPLVAEIIARAPPGHRGGVAAAWQRSVESWLAAVRREPPCHAAGFDAPLELAGWFAAAAAAPTGPLPAVIRWLSVAVPPPVPGQVSLFGHIPAPAVPTGSVVGLAAASPVLLLPSRSTVGCELVCLGAEPQERAIVLVGGAAPGRGSVDAA